MVLLMREIELICSEGARAISARANVVVGQDRKLTQYISFYQRCFKRLFHFTCEKQIVGWSVGATHWKWKLICFLVKMKKRPMSLKSLEIYCP